jgi:hypothetical protein
LVDQERRHATSFHNVFVPFATTSESPNAAALGN